MSFEFDRVILYWVNHLSFVVRKELQLRFAVHGEQVSPEEWAVLMHLWKEDALTPSRLADATIRDRTTMTRLLDSMVAKGLVIRKPDHVDRRRVLVCLSPKARALEQVLVPIARELIEDALSGIPETESAAALRTLRKMTENLLRSHRR